MRKLLVFGSLPSKQNGFGSEAAKAVRDRAFENTEYDCLYSYMKYTNISSYSTAIANEMKKVKEFPDEKNKISYAYAIKKCKHLVNSIAELIQCRA